MENTGIIVIKTHFSIRDITNVRIKKICKIIAKNFLEETFLHLHGESKRRQYKKVWCKQAKMENYRSLKNFQMFLPA